MKRSLVVFSLILAFLLSSVGVQAATNGIDAAKLRDQVMPTLLQSTDYRSAVNALHGRAAVDTANVAIQSAGTSPDGKAVYTVAVGTKGAARDTAHAVLAFVELDGKQVKVLAVGLVNIGAKDKNGHRTFEISNPGRSQTVQSEYNPQTGEVLSTTAGGKYTASVIQPTAEEIQGKKACTWICWLAATVACAAVCIPIGMVTGGVGGFVCSTVCSAVFNWVYSYCP